jgi:hypothetical protein
LYSVKTKTLKLALLLAQYLYANKKLDLPGIGTFHLDPSVVIDPENDKNSKKAEPIEGIRFDYNISIKDNPELVDYIASKTGKIKALAAADLDSHLWLGQQFLNIGKPFVLDGIGQLIKTQAGPLEFQAGFLQPDVLKEQPGHQPMADHSSQEGENDYKDLLNPRKDKVQWKKPLAFLLIIAGLVVAVWGGYTIYKKNSQPEIAADPGKNNTEPEVKPDIPQGSTTPAVNNTVPGPAPVNTVSAPAGSFKFVVETAGKQRALARYQKLKNLPTDIKLETTDSVNFKLYFLLNASPADTAKLLDSLRMYYTPKWSKAFIER